MTTLLNALLLAAAAYLIGSLPFGVWVGRLFTGRDIRAGGSGHTGATNVFRQAGVPAAALVMALDTAKGFAAAWLAVRLGAAAWAPAAAVGAVTAGHCWPALARFRGGMGLATLGGAMLAVYPLGFVVGLGVLVGLTLLLRHGARAMVIGGAAFGPLVIVLAGYWAVGLAALAGGLVVAMRATSDWNRVYRELWLDRPARAPTASNES